MSNETEKTSPWLIAFRVIFTIAVAGCILFIFSNSLEIGPESSARSQAVMRYMNAILDRIVYPLLGERLRLLLDPASAQARQLATASDFDQKTVLKKGTLKAYDLSLSGTIIKQTASVGRARTLSYFFSLILTDNRTGEVVWKYTDELKRGDVRSAIGW